MKHLCIINPMAGQIKGRVHDVEETIRNFFYGNPRMNYSIHITRWKRDASGYTLRYVNKAPEVVRVYAFGGGGTLFEVINGVIGLPNVQVAYFPLGSRNDNLIAVFGNDQKEAFKSMKNLSLSPVITIDTILAGNHHVVTSVLIGIETVAYQLGLELSERIKLPYNVCNFLAGVYYTIINPRIRRYRIEMEDEEIDGEYAGVFIANASGKELWSSDQDILFNDGFIDIYTIKPAPKNKIINVLRDYQSGQYAKWPEYIAHYRCKKLRITSPTDMTISLDGEIFYDRELNFEIRSASLDFVCPVTIDEALLSRKPEERAVIKDFQLEDFLDGDLS